MVQRRGFSRTGPLVGRGLRRKTAWGIGPGSSAALNISASGASLVGLGAASTLEGSTCVRIRGELLITLISVTSSLDGMRGAFGIGIVSNPAFTAGIGSVPTPITEASDENWLYHRFFTVIGAQASETWGNAGSAVLRVEVDTKAMR